MFDPARNLDTPRHRRYWLTEALLVAGILVFGGFALLSDARIKPLDLENGFTQVIDR